jgi:hypothetical protein
MQRWGWLARGEDSPRGARGRPCVIHLHALALFMQMSERVSMRLIGGTSVEAMLQRAIDGSSVCFLFSTGRRVLRSHRPLSPQKYVR